MICRSPSTPSGSRLVATSRTFGQPCNRAAATAAVARDDVLTVVEDDQDVT